MIREPSIVHGPAAAMIAVILIAAIGAGHATEQPAAVAVSPVQEHVLGVKARQEFLETRLLIDDANMAVRVNEIGRDVARISDRPGLHYQFLVVQGPELQAWSFPGGTVCITDALVDLYATDDELAFGLAHEVAHIALRHHISRYRLLVGLNSEKAGMQAMREAIMSTFDTGQEMEADRYAALYAVRADYSFTSAVEALNRLAQESYAPSEDAQHPDYSIRAEALTAFRQELDRSVAAFKVGTEALQTRKLGMAIERVEIFVAEFPRNIPGRVNLGAAYLAKVRESAPLELEETLPWLPESGVRVRGVYDQVDLERAGRQFELALESDPDHPKALAGLALVELRLGEPVLARDHLERALALEPGAPELLLCLGNVYFHAGWYEVAMTYYEAALEWRPEWSAATKNLAIAFEKAGNIESARQSWSLLLDDDAHRREARLRIDDLDRLDGDDRE